MKKLILALAALAFAGGVHAADEESSSKATVDHSKNPLTGTKTTTKKWVAKKKGAHGDAETTTTETTKQMTDGSTTKKVETKTDAKTH